MFVRLTNGTPETYTIGRLRRDNPTDSFPRVISAETLARYNVYPVTPTPAPLIDSKTQRHVQEAQLVDDAWVQVWTVEPLPEQQAGANVRGHRNRLLSQTDWMALSDNTMTTEWASYRQALRDITSQGGFPYTIEWPTKPGE
jgi:hypothetical protein